MSIHKYTLTIVEDSGARFVQTILALNIDDALDLVNKMLVSRLPGALATVEAQ